MDTTSVDRGGAGHSSVKTYITGFILALTLTAIPFALVKFGGLSKGVILTVLFAAAICQMLVHLHYFLKLDTSSEKHWNVLALIFTAIIIFIMVGGSIWIMVSLHYNMLP